MRRLLLAALALLVALSGALLGQSLTPVLNGISPTQTTAGAPGVRDDPDRNRFPTTGSSA